MLRKRINLKQRPQVLRSIPKAPFIVQSSPCNPFAIVVWKFPNSKQLLHDAKRSNPRLSGRSPLGSSTVRRLPRKRPQPSNMEVGVWTNETARIGVRRLLKCRRRSLSYSLIQQFGEPWSAFSLEYTTLDDERATIKVFIVIGYLRSKSRSTQYTATPTSGM